MSKSCLLEADHLTKKFETGGFFKKSSLTAVDDVSFEISSEKPTINAIVGESGSGKSTLCNMILGLLEPTSGEVRYQGRSLRKMSGKKQLKYYSEVQAIFQDPYEIYNPFYKAMRILEIPIRKYKLASSPSQEREMILKSLDTVELTQEDVVGKYPHQLSGGQRQRLAIARALLLNPKLIVADEPVSMIDTSLKGGILRTMFNLKEKMGVSFLYITHDLSTAYNISDNIIVLYRGSVVEKGPINTVIKNPAHPYLQVLVNSVPKPDPEKKWAGKVEFKVETFTKGARPSSGCKFYDRCPQAMDICATKKPPDVILGGNHSTLCYLYSKQD